MKPEFCNKCYECEHHRELDWSAHSKCIKNPIPKVEGHEQGKRRGWFYFPSNFDPTWLERCDSFKQK